MFFRHVNVYNLDWSVRFQSSSQLKQTPLVKVTNDVFIASDSGLITVLVLLDLNEGFDTVDHKILLECAVGIIGLYHIFLPDSNLFIPQGSVLGPFFFLLDICLL